MFYLFILLLVITVVAVGVQYYCYMDRKKEIITKGDGTANDKS
jgi:hypothetical protein